MYLLAAEELLDIPVKMSSSAKETTQAEKAQVETIKVVFKELQNGDKLSQVGCFYHGSGQSKLK